MGTSTLVTYEEADMKRRSLSAAPTGGRRRFLKEMATAGGAAALAATAGSAAAAVPSQEVASGAERSGYRESPHVRQYYKTARM